MDAVRVALLREVLAGTEWLEATRRFAGTLRASVGPHGGGLLLVGSEAYEPWHLAAHLDDEAAWAGLPELSPTLVRHRVRPGEPAHLAVGLGRIEAAGRGETLLVVTPERPDEGLLERVHDARRSGATVLALDGGDRDLHALAHEALAAPGGLVPPGTGAAAPGTGMAAPGSPGGRVAPGTGAVPPGTGAAGGRDVPAGLGGSAAPAGPGGPAVPAGAAEAGRGSEFGFETVQHLVSAAAGENRLPSPRSRRGFRDRLARIAEQLTLPPPARW
ncbi:hypothetical protein [Streptomyces sp. 7N604]|uniref:hypothetical protein n=1 Tax=Streptomyces sp. 7N604 TaxID=3457415 RepID=UPI003FD3E9A0